MYRQRQSEHFHLILKNIRLVQTKFANIVDSSRQWKQRPHAYFHKWNSSDLGNVIKMCVCVNIFNADLSSIFKLLKWCKMDWNNLEMRKLNGERNVRIPFLSLFISASFRISESNFTRTHNNCPGKSFEYDWKIKKLNLK